jgi:hypothetical protein
VERVGSWPLAFHAFPSPGISTALSSSGFRGGYRQGGAVVRNYCCSGSFFLWLFFNR